MKSIESKKIKLLGADIELYPRTTADVLAAAEYYRLLGKEQEADVKIVLYFRALILAASVSAWMRRKNFFVRLYYRHKFSIKNLMRNLTPRELEELSGYVLKLEGVKVEPDKEEGGDEDGEPKKKVASQ